MDTGPASSDQPTNENRDALASRQELATRSGGSEPTLRRDHFNPSRVTAAVRNATRQAREWSILLGSRIDGAAGRVDRTRKGFAGTPTDRSGPQPTDAATGGLVPAIASVTDAALAAIVAVHEPIRVETYWPSPTTWLRWFVVIVLGLFVIFSGGYVFLEARGLVGSSGGFTPPFQRQPSNPFSSPYSSPFQGR